MLWYQSQIIFLIFRAFLQLKARLGTGILYFRSNKVFKKRQQIEQSFHHKVTYDSILTSPWYGFNHCLEGRQGLIHLLRNNRHKNIFQSLFRDSDQQRDWIIKNKNKKLENFIFFAKPPPSREISQLFYDLVPKGLITFVTGAFLFYRFRM